MEIRDYAAEDAAEVVRLYNAHPDNPNPVRGGISTEQFVTELAERGTKAFLVAEDEGQVVGTFGMFASNGRHTVGDREAFADMFFVAPAHRRTMLTGKLFSAAVETMFDRGVDVLRLTVNPANAAAFKLYRRVGCVSVRGHVPGEDANVELHNYIPLILRTVRDQMGEEGRRALGAMTSFGCITTPLDDHLSADAVERDGRLVVDYTIDLGPAQVNARIDVARGEVLTASVVHGDSVREVVISSETASSEPRSATVSGQHHLSHGPLSVDLDGDGAIVVGHADCPGPLLVTTWPSPQTHRAAGWRQGGVAVLHGEVSRDRLVVHDADGLQLEVEVAVSPDGFVLSLDYEGEPGSTLRLFQQCGLRQSLLTARPLNGEPLVDASAGLNVAVRDASEIAAASLQLQDASPVMWQEGRRRVTMSGPGRCSLVHSTLVDRRLVLDAHGRARITITAQVPTHEVGGVTDSGLQLAADKEKVVFTSRAGGITLWRDGDSKVLRCPWPRTQRIGSNPCWRAGMWVTRELDRHDRRQGLGWGLNRFGWEPDGRGLRCADQDLSWSLDGGPTTGWTVNLITGNSDGELVVWLTPATAAEGHIKAADHQTTTVLDLGRTWQRSTTRAAIPLRHGKWLLIEPDPQCNQYSEILLRNTDQGLLVGCVSSARASTASWRFAIATHLPTHSPRRNDYTTAF